MRFDNVRIGVAPRVVVNKERILRLSLVQLTLPCPLTSGLVSVDPACLLRKKELREAVRVSVEHVLLAHIEPVQLLRWVVDVHVSSKVCSEVVVRSVLHTPQRVVLVKAQTHLVAKTGSKVRHVFELNGRRNRGSSHSRQRNLADGRAEGREVHVLLTSD